MIFARWLGPLIGAGVLVAVPVGILVAHGQGVLPGGPLLPTVFVWGGFVGGVGLAAWGAARRSAPAVALASGLLFAAAIPAIVSFVGYGILAGAAALLLAQRSIPDPRPGRAGIARAIGIAAAALLGLLLIVGAKQGRLGGAFTGPAAGASLVLLGLLVGIAFAGLWPSPERPSGARSAG